MAFDPEYDFDPAPDCFRDLFSGQALSHLDEIVLSWRLGGHPIDWNDADADFQVHLADGPACLFRVFAPSSERPASIEVDTIKSVSLGIPSDLVQRLWSELADIGKLVENPHVPLSVPLGKFSRGDRKVFLAYALTIARCISVPPQSE